MAETQTAAAADPFDPDIVGETEASHDRPLPAVVVDRGLGPQRRGGFVDRLDQDGRADRLAPRRVFVQARQIYCFAKAAQMGWYPEGREIALKGLDHLLTKAKSPDGRPGFVHTLAPDGAVLDPLRDTYDHAFVLLALATRLCARSRCAGPLRDRRAAVVSGHATALAAWRLSGRIAGVDAAAAKSADASVRSDDRGVRRDPRPGVPEPRRRLLRAVSRQPLRQAETACSANISRTTGRGSSRSASNPDIRRNGSGC